MNQHEIYKKIVWRGGDDLDDVNLEKLASLLAEMEKRIEGLEQRASWKDSPEGKKIVGDTLNNILHPQAECKHICDSEEYNPKCHKCGKLMRNDNPQEEKQGWEHLIGEWQMSNHIELPFEAFEELKDAFRQVEQEAKEEARKETATEAMMKEATKITLERQFNLMEEMKSQAIKERDEEIKKAKKWLIKHL